MVGFYCRIIFTWASKIEAMYERLCAVANPGEGPGGTDPPPPSHPPPLTSRPNWGPKGRKKKFKTAPPYLMVWMTSPPPPPPLIWRSGSATGLYLRSSCKLTEVELCLLRVTFRTLEVFKLHVYGNRQTSDSSWAFLRIEKEQIKTAQTHFLKIKSCVKLLIYEWK